MCAERFSSAETETKELIAVIECSDTDGIRLKEESTRIFYVILVNRKSN